MIVTVYAGYVLLCVLMAYLGYRRGCFSSLKGLLRLSISLAIPLLLTRPVAGYLGERYLYPLVYGRINGILTHAASGMETATEEMASRLLESLPSILRPYITVTPSLSVGAMVEDLSHTASARISEVLALILVAALLFLSGYFLATLLARLAERLLVWPPLRTADRVLGLVFGGLSGLILISFFYTVSRYVGI